MITQTRLPLLVSKTASGDREAFEQLIVSQKNCMYLKIRSITGNTEDTEDIAQNIAIRIYQNIGALKNPEAFGSWLNKMVIRECIRHIAGRKPSTLYEDSFDYEDMYVETDTDYLPLARVELCELHSEVVAALARIPETARKIVIMYYGRGMCYQEISDSLGLSVGTVSAYLYRAKKRLRKELHCS